MKMMQFTVLFRYILGKMIKFTVFFSGRFYQNDVIYTAKGSLGNLGSLIGRVLDKKYRKTISDVKVST